MCLSHCIPQINTTLRDRQKSNLLTDRSLLPLWHGKIYSILTQIHCSITTQNNIKKTLSISVRIVKHIHTFSPVDKWFVWKLSHMWLLFTPKFCPIWHDQKRCFLHCLRMEKIVQRTWMTPFICFRGRFIQVSGAHWRSQKLLYF